MKMSSYLSPHHRIYMNMKKKKNNEHDELSFKLTSLINVEKYVVPE